MFKKVLLIIAVIIAGIIIWLAVIDGSYHVKRTVSVNVPVSEAYAFVSDYNNWPSWSPWLIMEKDIDLVFTGEPGKLDHGYTWKGKLVGAGEMNTKSLKMNERIDQGLFFKEPFPSQSDVYWEFSGDTAQTTITWGMTGTMPFFFKFMASQMEPMIGMDYERGLSMLKEKLETGQVSSQVKVLGLEEVPPIKYIGVKGTITYEQMESFMAQAYATLNEVVMNEKDLSSAGPPMTVYHDFGLDGGPVELTAAIPVTGNYQATSAVVSGELPAGKVLKVQHFGKYEHIGNAWSTAFSHSRFNKIKPIKNAEAYEVYITDPTLEPDPNKWETIVSLPVK